jgi:hypothetical protein
MSLGSVWITLPKAAWPTSAGSIPARSTAALTQVAASSVGGVPARLAVGPYCRSNGAQNDDFFVF